MTNLLALVVAALASWQARTIFALILADLGLGLFGSLRNGTFDASKVALFYKTNVLPYLGGYVLLYLIVHLLIPPSLPVVFGLALSGLLTEGAVLLAWGVLMTTLQASVRRNFALLYPVAPTELTNGS